MQDNVELIENVFVGEADHTIAKSREILGPSGVVVDLFCVLVTVDFDDEVSLDTDEIDDELTQRLLAPELVSGEAAAA